MLKEAHKLNLDSMTTIELQNFVEESRNYKLAAAKIFGDQSIDSLEAVIFLHAYAQERLVLIEAIDDLDHEWALNTAYLLAGIYDRLPVSVQWRERE